MTRTCKAHCRNCDRCFAGDRAFDAHRMGSHDASGIEGRRCLNPVQDPRDRFDVETGECRISEAEVRRGRLIWFLRRNRERVLLAREAGRFN